MSTFAGTYNASYAEMQHELLSGESLLWSGQPQKKVIFHEQDWYTIPFSLLWGGFAIFWEWGVTNQAAKSGSTFDIFQLWGIPFILIGQYMIWGRFFYTAWKKGRTYYAVTNKRVIVLNVGSTRKITDTYFSNLTSASLSVRADGIGTIKFAPETVQQANRWAFFTKNRQPLDIDLSLLVFYDIENARSVYQVIQTQRRSAPPTD
jgi:hypothetical protein